MDCNAGNFIDWLATCWRNSYIKHLQGCRLGGVLDCVVVLGVGYRDNKIIELNTYIEGEKMKLYQAFSQMTKEEIAAILYLQYLPFFDAFKIKDKQREEIKQSIRAMLDKEVKGKTGCVVCKDHIPNTPLKVEDVNGNTVEIAHAVHCSYCGRLLTENWSDKK